MSVIISHGGVKILPWALKFFSEGRCTMGRQNSSRLQSKNSSDRSPSSSAHSISNTGERTMTTPYSLQTDVRSNSKTQNWIMDHGQGDEEDEHFEYYISQSMRERMNNDTNLTEEDKRIIQYLALRKFHIPGQTFWQDYRYWFCNNHPFFCFCYADPRHPLGRWERILNLASSLAFGLAATCCVFIWFYYHDMPSAADGNGNAEESSSAFHFNDVIFTIPLFVGGKEFNVTLGILVLLAFSGPLHVLFDLSIYFLQACPPCRPHGFFDRHSPHIFPKIHQQVWLWIGTHAAFLITVSSLLLAIQVTLMRASLNEGDGDDEDLSYSVENYSFMLYYLLEIFVANFVAFPLATFTVFSGVLGCCGRVPGLGGRPYQVRKHERLLQRQEQQSDACVKPLTV